MSTTMPTDDGAGDWPKAWNDIVSRPDGNAYHHSGPRFQSFGPVRIYDGTMYVNADAGRETRENRDAWLPFERYLAVMTDD